jgi:hypothetical protein
MKLLTSSSSGAQRVAQQDFDKWIKKKPKQNMLFWLGSANGFGPTFFHSRFLRVVIL